ncbi:disease resistance-like protein DSC1 [Neltuma alba]|uniref:disease resistance-like protein DSC1 n=1 Tax=Neltuma alba TaxID=207710 RepID=UPI0010A41BAA|nr:disease resistance-like protein DSC1 [Prosopis alba]XP_028801128.1 disease resistance-like protein DSC1 [Prosopis alba]XP_028801130.1 disease resistance-like protein DSC1 [Prosopis alba]XP_028801131.1 disease resistance-like protein DSC1 [Prosopis alba]
MLLSNLVLGRGSRVIATSRDKHVLISGGIDEKYIYEVEELNFKESLELFSRHAFGKIRPNMGYEELSRRTVDIAKGIPLALEILGSHFHSKNKDYWESELERLQKCPLQRIQNILKVSFYGLHPMDREIFLDIAFFFLGVEKAELTYALEACHLGAISGIQNLIDKALIKLDGHDRIVMHDLIREMAEQIVREECMKHPERRSRLNDENEICDILKSNMGTDEIEGMILFVNRIKNLQLSADAFMKMRNLRILKILDYSMGRPNTRIELPHGLDYLPDKLRYFYWDYCPLKSLPFGSYLKNLVELDMRRSNVEKLWDGKQDLEHLKKIDLSWSQQLRELADFSMARKLEFVYLRGCKNLRTIHPSILSLNTIVEVWVNDCPKLESIESETHLESLTLVWASGCDNLKKFSLSSKKLRKLYLNKGHKLEIFHLPNSHCTELRTLDVDGEGLRGLPMDELRCLTNLERFCVDNFKQEIHTMELHSLFDAWRNLTELYLERWSFLLEIPDNIKHLSNLKRFFVTECKRLKSILGLPPMLLVLGATDCTSLETVSSDSLVLTRCDFYFHNCVKLDERSHGFIEELTHSSLTSLTLASNEDGHYFASTCYPGSRVPKWMEYRPMTEDSNAIEFTCNPKRSHDILFCCVGPSQAVSKGFFCGVYCECYWDDNKKYRFGYYDHYCVSHSHELNQDHVFLWYIHRGLFAAKISCEFFAEFLDEHFFSVPAKACGVHVIYH